MNKSPLKIAITLACGATVFAAVAFNGSQMPPKQQKEQPIVEQKSEPINPLVLPQELTQSIAPQVSVLNVQTGTYQSQVIGFGEARSKYQLDYTVEINGRVNTLHPNFETGKVVKKDQQLAIVDQTQYLQALLQAKADVAQARLNLLEEQRQGEQAKSEWLRSGINGEPASPLVLREPQLLNVTAKLNNAKQALVKAQRDLDNTQLKAPFDAVIVERNIQPGSYLQVGNQIATLYSIDTVEIEIPLSQQQWQTLPNLDNKSLSEQLKGWDVSLTSAEGNGEWQGYVARVEQHLEQNTRQRSLIVVVDKPLQQEVDLYPGVFLKASISGRSMDNLWQLPASAISQQGDIWFVGADSTLSKSKANVLFSKNGLVFVSPINDSTITGPDASLHIVKRPLSSYKAGMKVNAIVEG